MVQTFLLNISGPLKPNKTPFLQNFLNDNILLKKCQFCRLVIYDFLLKQKYFSHFFYRFYTLFLLKN